MIEIILVRHGRTEANEKEIYGCDYPLSFTGKTEAIRARKTYLPLEPDRVYTSTLKRAIGTAVILFSKPVPEYMRYPAFNEIYFGTAETKTYSGGTEGYENQFEDDFVAFMEECEGDDPYERAEEAIRHIREIADDICMYPKEYPNRKVVIITSNTLMMCIALTLMRGRDWRRVMDIEPFENLEGLRLIFTDSEAECDSRLVSMIRMSKGYSEAIWTA